MYSLSFFGFDHVSIFLVLWSYRYSGEEEPVVQSIKNRELDSYCRYLFRRGQTLDFDLVVFNSKDQIDMYEIVLSSLPVANIVFIILSASVVIAAVSTAIIS